VGGLVAGGDGGAVVVISWSCGDSNSSELLVGGVCGNNPLDGGGGEVNNSPKLQGFAGNNPPELSVGGGKVGNNSPEWLGGMMVTA